MNKIQELILFAYVTLILLEHCLQITIYLKKNTSANYLINSAGNFVCSEKLFFETSHKEDYPFAQMLMREGKSNIIKQQKTFV